jgi:hypothetical protein
MHVNAFDYFHLKPRRRYLIFQFADILRRPNIAHGYIQQRRHNPRHAGYLPYLFQCHAVVFRPEPPKCQFHSNTPFFIVGFGVL